MNFIPFPFLDGMAILLLAAKMKTYAEEHIVEDYDAFIKTCKDNTKITNVGQTFFCTNSPTLPKPVIPFTTYFTPNNLHFLQLHFLCVKNEQNLWQKLVISDINQLPLSAEVVETLVDAFLNIDEPMKLLPKTPSHVAIIVQPLKK